MPRLVRHAIVFGRGRCMPRCSTFKHVASALENLDDDEKGVGNAHTLGGIRRSRSSRRAASMP